jgi:predicted HAD superfamily Cof-like phosphohydrolase
MTRTEVEFLVKMMCGELMELLVTVTDDKEDARQVLKGLVDVAEYPTFKAQGQDDVSIMAEQVDALVDVNYYGLNAAAKVGFNVDQVFDVVHQANMDKRSKEDGMFHRNSEGKVIKPVGWKEPDVKAVVSRWAEHGTWQ